MITFEEVSKSFGSQQVLHDVTFTARAGAVTGFVGPNGAGKSTALRILLGLAEPDAGRALIDGVGYRELADAHRAVGALIHPQWIPSRMTGAGYLEWVADLRGRRDASAAALLESVGLEGASRKRVADFSMGMRQRLGIAAALMGEPRVLVLDEPINGLDIDAVRWIRTRLRAAADAGACVLLSSHLLSELELVADDVVMLSHGRVVSDGPMAEVRVTDGSVVTIECADAQALAEHLTRHGFSVRVVHAGVEVDADRLEPVALEACRAGVEITRIERPRMGLEDAYLGRVAAQGAAS